MEWAQVATVIAAISGVIGLQTFWIARALDDIGRRLDRVEARLDHFESREPPSLRRI